MIVTTTPDINGRSITEYIGIVSGSSSTSKNTIRDMISNIQGVFGREIRASVKMMDKSRQLALERLQKNAEDLKADAVVNLRFTTAQVRQGSAEVMAYGTAVKVS